ncbi:hypothetical protein ACFZDK_20795 [Streptomyces sp. NPDC007901]
MGNTSMEPRAPGRFRKTAALRGQAAVTLAGRLTIDGDRFSREAA